MRELSFVHISDSHLGASPDHRYDDSRSRDALNAILSRVRNLQRRVDFVVHTGDLAAEGEPAAYAKAKQAFSRLSVPVYHVAGNHDDPVELLSSLGLPDGRQLLAGTAAYAYELDILGHRLIAFDGVFGAGRSPSGSLGSEQLAAIGEALASRNMPTIVVGHFPLLPCGVPWIDEEMLLEEGPRLHELLVRHRDSIRGVFLGHVHYSSVKIVDGVLYCTAPAGVRQVVPGTSHRHPVVDYSSGPGFHHVSIRGGSVEVVTYAVPTSEPERSGGRQ